MSRRWQPPWLELPWTPHLVPWRVGLAAAGVAPGDRVSIDLPRCTAWVYAVMGIWSMGASVVPLDPRWPVARRQECVRQARCGAHVGRPLPGVDVPWVGPCDGSDPARVGFDSQREAWVCFSSGSSGHPKGISVGFRGVEGLVRAQRAAFGLRHGARVGWALSPGFDASFSDVLTALDVGALPVCAPPGILGRPDALLDWLRSTAVACIDLPPALLPHIDPRRLPPTLRTVVVGGEVADPDALRAWARRVRVVAVYGPTEATVCTHLTRVDPETWRRAALGAPIPGVVDAVVQQGRLCAEDVPGELWLAGPCLAREYVGAPERTADRFIEADLGGGVRRWFRTRDKVVRTGDGLVFLGRMDRVVKVAGQLVALPEVEAALERQPTVRAAAVVTLEGQLVAFVEGAGCSEAVLRRALLDTLAPHMVPRRIEVVSALPRGTSGKVLVADLRRSALNVPQLQMHQTELEQVCAAWSAVLGRPVFVDSRLTAMGRDSLATLEVHARLQREGHIGSIAQLAEAATPRECVGDTAAGFDLHDLEHWVPVPPSGGGVCAPRSPRGARVLVLGATGFVGSAVVAEWCSDPSRPGLVALVRARSVAAAQARLRAVLADCGWREGCDPIESGQLVVVPGDVGAPRLGLSRAQWDALVAQTGLVVDLAGVVSLAADFSSLRTAHLAPISELARLAEAAGGVGVVHAGTLSVFVERMPRRAQVVVDGAALPRSGRLGSAYAASKWVAERAWQRWAPGPLHVLRFGLVVGDTVTGRPAQRSQLSALLRGMASGSLAPVVDPDAAINLTPRDLAARAVVNELDRCWAAPHVVRPPRHIVHPRSATVAELRDAADPTRSFEGPTELLASTVTDPIATGFLSTGVQFVPLAGQEPRIAPMSDAAWMRFLHVLVRGAVEAPGLAGRPWTGQIGPER